MYIPRHEMTQQIANEYLSYDYSTGYLYRKKKYHNNVVKGRRACRVTNNKHQDHLVVKLHGVDYPAHRLIWLMIHGYFPTGVIDHIDHNEHNNRLENLREVTQQENNRNYPKRLDNTSGITGVWERKDVSNQAKRYVAEIRDDKNKKKSKSFYTFEEAVIQRKLWEQQYGYHQNHGK